ncbi:MAG: flagellar biosynthesis anti-sigma factor FlgM [Treponema sp.]|nr:flagellar biosynthesis anti-sigma factor FlgM [Treponema sp.]
MMINKLSGVNPVNNVQNTKKAENVAKANAGFDSVDVSDEAKLRAEAYYLKQVANDTPDIRADRVAEVKEKLKDPSYLNNAVIQSAAEGIMASFGL